MLGAMLIRHKVVQVRQPREKRLLAPLGMMEAFHHEELPVDGVMRVIELGAGHRHRVLFTGVCPVMYFASILHTQSFCSGPVAGGHRLVCLAHTLFVTSASARWMGTTDS
jgi:hypothetical protein